MASDLQDFLASFDSRSSGVDHEFGYHGAIRDLSITVKQLEAGRDALAAQATLEASAASFVVLRRLVHVIRVVFGHLPRHADQPEKRALLHKWTDEIGRIAGR